jgi:6-phosphogluconolactonase (cycloisomerase 2 family)
VSVLNHHNLVKVTNNINSLPVLENNTIKDDNRNSKNKNMTILYVTTSSNKFKVVEVDNENGTLVRIVQTIDPIVDPLPVSGDGKPLPTKGAFQPVTEWIEKHPLYNLVYVLTSFWSYTTAMVTTYRIADTTTGRLEKIGNSVSTGGLQAAHATFSPDASTFCVCHHNDGIVSFFDCTHDDTPLSTPFKIIATPELIPGTRTTKFPAALPSVHHVQYGPKGRYLLTSDSSKQGRVWTYQVDERGVPCIDTNNDHDRPSSSLKVTYVTPPSGWLGYAFSSYLMGMPYRIRRSVVHPNGRYVYLLMETNATIQIYEIDDRGRIFGDCLQELPVIDPAFFGRRWTGIAVNCPAELYVTETEVFVSNRGIMASRFGSGESGIRIFTVDNDGSKLSPKQFIDTTSVGPVRHFWMNKESTKLHLGINMGKPELIETYVRKDSSCMFEKVGQANVEMDVLCIASM